MLGGGGGGGGPSFSCGPGVQMLIPIETYSTCDQNLFPLCESSAILAMKRTLLCLVWPLVVRMSVHCSLVVTCWERANLLAILYMIFSCVFVTFSCGVLG